MTLTIHDTTMTSDQTDCTARQAPTRDGWDVSWLPGQVLDHNTASMNKPADSRTGRPLTDQRDTCAGQITV